MAIRAKQSQIPRVRIPIAKAMPPGSARRANFGGCVDVVNIEGAMIIKPAIHTFTAKRRDKSKFLAPVGRLFIETGAVFNTKRHLTFNGAITHFARLPAVFALSITVPPVRKITGLATIFSGSLAQSVRMHLGRLVAACANDCRWCGSHASMIAKYVGYFKPRYFDIACRRIEQAQRQADLFVRQPDAPKPVQEAIF